MGWDLSTWNYTENESGKFDICGLEYSALNNEEKKVHLFSEWRNSFIKSDCKEIKKLPNVINAVRRWKRG